MATITRFEDLGVWKQARELYKKIRRISETTSLSKDFSLKDQILRSRRTRRSQTTNSAFLSACYTSLNGATKKAELRTVFGFPTRLCDYSGLN